MNWLYTSNICLPVMQCPRVSCISTISRSMDFWIIDIHKYSTTPDLKRNTDQNLPHLALWCLYYTVALKSVVTIMWYVWTGWRLRQLDRGNGICIKRFLTHGHLLRLFLRVLFWSGNHFQDALWLLSALRHLSWPLVLRNIGDHIYWKYLYLITSSLWVCTMFIVDLKQGCTQHEPILYFPLQGFNVSLSLHPCLNKWKLASEPVLDVLLQSSLDKGANRSP